MLVVTTGTTTCTPRSEVLARPVENAAAVSPTITVSRKNTSPPSEEAAFGD